MGSSSGPVSVRARLLHGLGSCSSRMYQPPWSPMNSDLNPTSRSEPTSPSSAYVVGLDAGGTRTRAVLAPVRAGDLEGEGVGGPGNALTVPGPQLIEHLAAAVARAVPE